MEILIENMQEKVDVTQEMYGLIKDAVVRSIQLEGFDIPSEVSIVLVDNEQIREINQQHRDIDRPTDVLSFPMADIVQGKLQSDQGDMDMDEDLLLLGDIVLSMEKVSAQAEEYGHSFQRELAFLTTHGTYHLLGYDHGTEEEEKVMLAKQETVLQEMGFGRDEE